MAIHFNLADLIAEATESAPTTLLPLEMQLDFIESKKLVDRIRALAAAEIRDGSGINFLGQYCSITGAQISSIDNESVLLQISQSFGIEKITDDELVDDMMTRCIAGMRPSPLWVSMTPERIKHMAFVDPVGVAVYLVMRCFEKEVMQHKMPNGRQWSTFEGSIHLNRKRIELHMALAKVELDSLRDLLLALMQVDARVGLPALPSMELLVDSTAVANLDWFIREVNNPRSHRTFVNSVIRIYQQKLDAYYQDEIRLERQSKANTVTRGFFEWFAREHAPKSKIALVAEVKREKARKTDAAIMAALEDFDVAALKPQGPAPAPKPAKPVESTSAKIGNRPTFASLGMIGALKIGVK